MVVRRNKLIYINSTRTEYKYTYQSEEIVHSTLLLNFVIAFFFNYSFLSKFLLDDAPKERFGCFKLNSVAHGMKAALFTGWMQTGHKAATWMRAISA
jgi:hypothetical protein